MSKLKTLFKIVIAITIFFGVRRFCEDRTDGFSVVTIDQNIPYDKTFEVTDSGAEVPDQRFYFLGRGGQSYVFVSQDKKTVLKFFKKHHTFPDSLVEALTRALPPSLHNRYMQTRAQRFASIFSSCKLAYEHLQEETGILYLHLNPTQNRHKPIQIIDRCGIAHTINLDTASFILQKRGELVLSKIKKQMRGGDVEGARRSIHSMIRFIAAQCRQGIRDTDKALRRNYGFIEDQPASIDVGSFIIDHTLKTPEACKREVTHKTHKMRRWLVKYYPDLVSVYDEEMALDLNFTGA